MKLERSLAAASIAAAIFVGAGSVTVAAPSSSLAHGIDVSEYQGTINWSKVAGGGISFAIARVSDGTQHPDPYFKANWSGMKANGIVRGVYQFFRPEENAVAQADLLINATTFEPGDLPPFLDFEVTDKQSASTMTAGIAAWCNEIKAKTGLTPIIYTSPGFWNGLGVKAPAGVQLWVANWGVSSPRVPSGWSGWAFWQWSDTSSVPGVSNADSDVFNGSVAQLQAYAQSHGTIGTVGGGGGTGGGGGGGTGGGGGGTGGSQPILRQGATGPAVVTLQQDLAAAGFSPGAIDGDFGPATLAAVKAFQSANGLVADGIVGPLTWAALTQAATPAPAPAPTPAPSPSPSPTPSSHPTLKEGATGPDVVTLQQDLAAAGFSPGTIDGDFGPNTLAAVKAFQAANGLTVDGIVGPQTWAALTGSAPTAPTPAPTKPTPTPTPAPPPAPATLTFSHDVQPILQAQCVRCHPGAGLPSLQTYNDAMQFVVAGNSASSKLVQKTNGGSMSGYLSTAQAQTIKAWVDQGAHP